jgi:hypothetical protein
MKYGNVLHNYGAIPQTWEDPGHTVSAVNNLPGVLHVPLAMCSGLGFALPYHSYLR